MQLELPDNFFYHLELTIKQAVEEGIKAAAAFERERLLQIKLAEMDMYSKMQEAERESNQRMRELVEAHQAKES